MLHPSDNFRPGGDWFDDWPYGLQWIARIAWWGIRAFLVIVAIVVIQRFCAAGCQGVTGGFECPEPDCPSHSR